ncbi:MAG: ABC transporter ATP-binding protein [Endomicrobiia bacterium]
MNDSIPIVEVKNLYKSYNNKNVLQNISFEVYRGEIFVLLGPNGAGKTTTVKIVAGVIQADSGDVFVMSEKISVFKPDIKKHIGYLPDEPYIYNKLTGKEFLEFIFSVYNVKINHQEYEFLLNEFELNYYINSPIETYSKGMKQKLLLMSIFLRKPDLFILDEPLIGLDPKSINFFKQYIKKLSKEGKTIILCTHLLDLAQQVATKIAIIYNGTILIAATLEDLAKNFCVSSLSLEEIYLTAIQKNS